MITFLSTVLAVVVILLLGAIARIGAIHKELVTIDREQHAQNKEILDLIKHKAESTEILLEHIEILKYLCEQDPMLRKHAIPYTGPIGEA